MYHIEALAWVPSFEVTIPQSSGITRLKTWEKNSFCFSTIKRRRIESYAGVVHFCVYSHIELARRKFVQSSPA